MRNLTSNSRRRRMTTLHAIGSEHDKNGDSETLEPGIAPQSEQSESRSAELSARLFDECGGNPIAQIQVERNGKIFRQESLHRPFLLIGGDPRCHLCLPGAEIKPQHFLLQWIEGSIFCCDLSQGTAAVSGKKSPTIGRWLDHQPIEVGRYRLSLQNFTPTRPANFSPVDRQLDRKSNLPQIGLRFSGVSEVANIWKFDRTLVLIGKSSLCKLRLNHPTMASTQAWLLQTSVAAWLIDFAGTGSTKVNGEAIRLAPIDIGDLLEFDQFHAEVVSTEFLFAAPPINGSLTRNQTAPSTNPYDNSLPPIRFDRPLENANPTNPLMEPLNRLSIPFPSDPLSTAPLVDASIPLPSENILELPPIATEVVEFIEREEQQPEPFLDALEQPVADDFVSATPTEVSELAPSIFEEIPAVHVETIAPTCERTAPNLQTAVVAVPVALPVVGVRIQPSIPATTRLHNYRSVNASVVIGEVLVLDATPKIQEVCSADFPTDQPALSADIMLVEEQIPRVLVCNQTGPSNELPLSIGEFIEAQKADIAQLRTCLAELQLAYEAAAGSLISRKVRDSLERPVLSTTECCDSLVRNLDRFTAAHKRLAE